MVAALWEGKVLLKQGRYSETALINPRNVSLMNKSDSELQWFYWSAGLFHLPDNRHNLLHQQTVKPDIHDVDVIN